MGEVLLHRLLVGVAAITFVVALVGIPARATYGARTTADEPQYLLTAISLAEDRDLDISDELAARRYEPFHEITVDQQTTPLDDAGQRLSPHDPLLPAILAGPMAVGGWPAAKATLAALAAALAALSTWVAVRRFDVRPTTAAIVVTAFAVAPPLVAYGTQVYPEIPAALAVMVAVAAITGPPGPRRITVAIVAVVALPWLSVKYLPVAAVLAALTLVPTLRRDRRRAVLGAAVLAGAGAVYLVVHQRVYGGWTVYAAGDHFVGGELDVVGSDPQYLARSRRLVGLVVDQRFGLAAWNPAWLLVLPALGYLFGAGRSHRWAVALPLAAGWATATWVALTMHGWWWPGRQVVVVLPLAVLTVAVAADRWRSFRLAAVFGGVVGATAWVWLAIESGRGVRTLIVDFYETSHPGHRAMAMVLPDHVRMGATDWLLTLGWVVLLVGLAWWGWRSGRRDQDAGRRERPDPDVAALDLDRGGAVG